MSLIAGRGCRWPPRRDSVSPCAPLSGGGRDTHDGHENSPILVFFSNLLGVQSLEGAREWSVEDIGHALSEEALTSAVMPRYHVDIAIRRALGSKFGSAKQARSA